MRITDASRVYTIEIAETKVRAAVKIIEQDGWFMVRRKESHREHRHSKENGVVTFARLTVISLLEI